MNREEVQRRVVSVVAHILGIEEVDTGANLEKDLGADSLNRLETITALEAIYPDVDFDEVFLYNLSTVDALTDHICDSESKAA
ncbi:hypothetical protein A3H65_01020 [Candidatus Giovannonibacteria bacterium RIFCSPLOWO2_02_FULL_45_14]|uniref:Carrier domain-containing protein n=1 Tax=Candidatus Giovannonibacteria bacterium RIFCSPLOWO2_12_FULL_44_15 TaxID=1798364 RepID=A0A1F5Y007_9BACT|nr:MAG: hypothetical protein A3C75_01445 [Candidatus Giovannonibacteria bacterium RIFCSPHIGHO2_02_FULL_44_31]OGF76026.1 MAG: hypothetical protein A3E62_01855 [Candidatus Giovannonibacteria bacterium RIFCSPHIGHO2_12_FULL_44_29]OGF90922.1 MAG: hypothetical protein A3H65_01020 [Candidatus Giovannonibacteria bacterium RIFCSPLOWO2_02_FULL_45_14]OGF93442.1 MAG: hypothetical protein A3G54_04090 [Candidatus Giovannonibacteria bacterium RIFCSPLOWO2_12_FULL_44_15]